VTGLYNFRARWYDPISGRWLSKDPIGISGGLNQYVAFGNNPVNFRDPWGEAKSQNNPPSYLEGVKNKSQARKLIELNEGHKTKPQRDRLFRRWEKKVGVRRSGLGRMRSVLGVVAWIPGIIEDISRSYRAKECNMTYSQQLEEELAPYPYIDTPYGRFPNPYFRPYSVNKRDGA
jgi:hypothetical protein